MKVFQAISSIGCLARARALRAQSVVLTVHLAAAVAESRRLYRLANVTAYGALPIGGGSDVAPQFYCAWCGEIIRRQPADDGTGMMYHVICLAKRRAADRRHDARRTRTVTQTLTTGAACLTCLVRTTGLPDAEIVAGLRRLRSDVSLTVGSCSRCGGEVRLLCKLAAA